jgi:hypothetical protein
MNHWQINHWKVSTLALVGLFTVVVGVGQLRPASAEPQPRMESALRHLREAREELQSASADKGGHREHALDFTTRAIRQVEEGIAFDNRRDDSRRERRR